MYYQFTAFLLLDKTFLKGSEPQKLPGFSSEGRVQASIQPPQQ